MRMNLGMWDRAIRVVAGLLILILGPLTSWAWLGLVPLFTGLAGFCPLYRALGWSTNRASAA
jgi:hypothetical protein